MSSWIRTKISSLKNLVAHSFSCPMIYRWKPRRFDLEPGKIFSQRAWVHISWRTCSAKWLRYHLPLWRETEVTSFSENWTGSNHEVDRWNEENLENVGRRHAGFYRSHSWWRIWRNIHRRTACRDPDHLRARFLPSLEVDASVNVGWQRCFFTLGDFLD